MRDLEPAWTFLVAEPNGTNPFIARRALARAATVPAAVGVTLPAISSVFQRVVAVRARCGRRTVLPALPLAFSAYCVWVLLSRADAARRASARAATVPVAVGDTLPAISSVFQRFVAVRARCGRRKMLQPNPGNE